MSSPEDVKGPIIVWEDYGLEGWSPRSFASLLDAVKAGAITGRCVVTVPIDLSKHVIEPQDGRTP